MAEVAGREAAVPRRVSRVVPDVTLLGYLVVVLVITLWPTPPDPASLTWLARLLAWAHDAGVPAAVDLVVLEAAANVALFVPLGALVPWARGVRPSAGLLAGLALSAAIELTQLGLPERFPTAQDVVMNTLGAGLGAAAVAVARARRRGRGAATTAVADHPPAAGRHPADPSSAPDGRPTGGHGRTPPAPRPDGGT